MIYLLFIIYFPRYSDTTHRGIKINGSDAKIVLQGKRQNKKEYINVCMYV